MKAVFHRKYAVLIPKTLLDDLSKNDLYRCFLTLQK